MSRLQHISTHVSDRPKPVFFDRSGKRWRLCLATLAAVAFIGIAGASLFVAGLFHDPRFPAIKIDDAERLRQDERNDQLGAQGTLVKTAYAEDKAALPTANVPHRGSMPARVSALPPVVFGFYVPWDENSLFSLKANSAHLTHVLAGWILQNGAGDLQDHTEISIVEWSRQAKLPVLAVVTNFRDDGWQSQEVFPTRPRGGGL